MRLKMDNKGEIVQVDSRFNDDRGAGRAPHLVQEDDVAKLSVGKERQEILDRVKADQMSRAGKLNYQRQQLMKDYKERLRLKLQEIAKNIVVNAKKTHSKKFQDKKDQVKVLAIRQGAKNLEEIGVSGSGLTSSGAKPYPTFPGRDWRIFESAPNDFGSLGAADGAMPSDYDRWQKPPVRQLPPTPKPNEDMYASMKAVETPIKGGFTTFHKFIIGLWENNSYIVKERPGARARDENGHYKRDYFNSYVYEFNPLTATVDTVITLPWKKRKWDELELFSINNRAEGQKEFLASSMRGWMWSGYFDDNENWIQVKVPFIYGLPMDFPEAPKSDDEMNHLNEWRKAQKIYRGDYSGRLFYDLRDVIHAYAMYYKYMLGDVEFKSETSDQIQVMDPTMTAAAESGDMKPIVDKVIQKKAVEAGSLLHPMLSEGLIPKKG